MNLRQKIVLIGLVVVAAAALAGCPYLDPTYMVEPPSVSALEVLEQRGIKAEVKTDKPDYSVGEPVHIWWSLTNVSTSNRTVECTITDEIGRNSPSVVFTIDSVLTSADTWRGSSSERIVVDVPAGQEVKVGEMIWDQKLTNGSTVSPGGHDVIGAICSVRVNGKVPTCHHDGRDWEYPTVRDWFRITIR